MKLIFNAIVLILITHQSFCQLFQPDPVGLNYFNQGSELLKKGFYNEADSFLTLALCSFKNEVVYYNRANSKLLMNDTIGYCMDLDIAANRYFDELAEKDFNMNCCSKIDTLYYDKKQIQVSDIDYRYYEIIKHIKYDSLIRGSYHDIKFNGIKTSLDFGCDNNLLGINCKNSDMIATYFIKDSIKTYVKASSRPIVSNRVKYDGLKKRAKLLLNNKYNHLKSQNNIENLRIYFRVFIDEYGKIIDVEYAGFFPNILYNDKEAEIKTDLMDIVNNYPNLTPAKFFKQKVKFAAYDFVDF